MAHRTNVNQVPLGFEAMRSSEKVRDPNCGKMIDRKSARHVLFRPEQTHYFCSRECEQEFLAPPKARTGARKKAF